MFIAGEEKGTTPSDTCCKDNRRYRSDYVSDSFCCISNVLLLPLQKLRKRTAMKYYHRYQHFSFFFGNRTHHFWGTLFFARRNS